MREIGMKTPFYIYNAL